jgi:predicted RNA-binding protein with PIN domain
MASYLLLVDGHAWSVELIARLEQLAHEHDLEAARAEELIEYNHPSSPSIQTALNAAVRHGIATGLRIAADLLREGR